MTAVGLSSHVSSPLAAAPPAGSGASSDSGFSFGDLLDIVNPLQHIPIVSTIYRAFTGDQIKTFPKIAGDTLFGGVAGFVSSVADTIFEKITGKSVGDTVLAWVEKEFSNPPSAIASTASVAPATTLDSIVFPSQYALPMALTGKSVERDLALRAANAYGSTTRITNEAAATALH